MDLFIYLQARRSLVAWLGDGRTERAGETRAVCWRLNCSGIPAHYGRCLRYVYTVRYSGFANPTRDLAPPSCLTRTEMRLLLRSLAPSGDPWWVPSPLPEFERLDRRLYRRSVKYLAGRSQKWHRQNNLMRFHESNAVTFVPHKCDVPPRRRHVKNR